MLCVRCCTAHCPVPVTAEEETPLWMKVGIGVGVGAVVTGILVGLVVYCRRFVFNFANLLTYSAINLS